MSPSSRVDKNHIKSLHIGKLDRMSSHIRSILSITPLKQLNFYTFILAIPLNPLSQIHYVLTKLLHRSGTKRITRGNQNRVPIVQEFEGYFGEISRFSDAVDADEGDCVGSLFAFADLDDFVEEVGLFCGGEDAG